MRAVWPETHVHPDNVKVLVREIRIALGDDPHAPTFIRSDAGRGYTFIAPVAERHNANLVGRSRELAALVEVLDDVRAGAPRVVMIGGERGVGKSRFCDLFLRMTGAAAALRSCGGECRPGDEPLAPVRRALAHLEQQAPALVRRILETGHPSSPPTSSHRAEASTVREPRAADELADRLQQLSRDVPLVIVIEDLQWADAATLDALHSLAQHRGAAKWMLIGTYCCSFAGRGFQAAMSRLTAHRNTKTLDPRPARRAPGAAVSR